MLKKAIASQLNSLAETMPHVLIEHDDKIIMLGHDLLLTPLANQVTDRNATYEVYIPKFIVVNHNQQLKDSYKRGGWDEVIIYVMEVFKTLGFTDQEIKELIQEKKQQLYN
jgi:hypothetical protein